MVPDPAAKTCIALVTANAPARFLRYNTPMDDTVALGTIETPAGTLGAAWTPDGLGYLALPTAPLAACEIWARRWMPHARLIRDDARLAELAGQLAAYFAGELRAFNIALDLRGTPFQLQVWRALQSIPYGEVRTYAALAAAIGRPQAVRAVGAANGANPVSIIIPCHRLIGSDGTLVGYGGGVAMKRRLLQLEGAPVS
jgi:O-6-methylguanine DNA methyltransferase